MVTAYGLTTQRLNTGNVTKVKGEDIAKQPVSNPILALEGRVPGLHISQKSINISLVKYSYRHFLIVKLESG